LLTHFSRFQIHCVEDKQFTADYHDPEKRFISNALTVTLNDGTVMDEVSLLRYFSVLPLRGTFELTLLTPIKVHLDFPVGHYRRREEGIPLLNAKFERHVEPHFPKEHVEK
jgi:2-methylcitrate dehydratase